MKKLILLSVFVLLFIMSNAQEKSYYPSGQLQTVDNYKYNTWFGSSKIDKWDYYLENGELEKTEDYDNTEYDKVDVSGTLLKKNYYNSILEKEEYYMNDTFRLNEYFSDGIDKAVNESVQKETERFDPNNKEDIKKLCRCAYHDKYEPSVAHRIRLPMVLSYLAQSEGIDVEKDRIVQERIPQIWKDNYSKLNCNDGTGFPGGLLYPNGSVLKLFILVHSTLFFNTCLNPNEIEYNIDLNLPDPVDGDTILTWLLKKKKNCPEKWCKRLMAGGNIERWEKRLRIAGALTNEEVEALKKK